MPQGYSFFPLTRVRVCVCVCVCVTVLVVWCAACTSSSPSEKVGRYSFSFAFFLSPLDSRPAALGRPQDLVRGARGPPQCEPCVVGVINEGFPPTSRHPITGHPLMLHVSRPTLRVWRAALFHLGKKRVLFPSCRCRRPRSYKMIQKHRPHREKRNIPFTGITLFAMASFLT